MANVFTEKPTHYKFTWEGLGDIKKGRENLGEDMPVLVYRLLEYTMLDILVEEYGREKADELFIKCGYKAGKAIVENVLDTSKELPDFVADLQKFMKDNKIGVLKIESFDEKTLDFYLTVGEDLDCSGLPPTDETVCRYDEGFIQGIMEGYIKGKQFKVREVDCWANGARVCRFKGEEVK